MIVDFSVLLMLAAMAIAIFICHYSWLHRDRAIYARRFTYVMLSIAWWAFAKSMEYMVNDPAQKLCWAKLCTISSVSISPVWLYFATEFSQRGPRFTRKNTFFMFLLPAIILVLAFTNEAHHLVWSKVTPIDIGAQQIRLLFEQGPASIIMVVYSYLLMVMGTMIILRGARQFGGLYRNQSLALIAGSIIPWIANVVYLSSISPWPWFDFTPIAFVASGAIFAWGLYRYQVLDIAPIAYDALVKRIPDGLVVLDPVDRVMLTNANALDFAQLDREPTVGLPVSRVLPFWNLLPEEAQTAPEETIEIEFPKSHWLEVRISSLRHKNDAFAGRMILLRDITNRKVVELAEHRQRLLAEGLVDTVTALTSTLQINEVFDRIMSRLRTLVDYESADIMLIEKNRVSIARIFGSERPDMSEEFVFDLSQVRNLSTIYETGKPLHIPDTLHYDGWVELENSLWIRAYLGFPLQARGKVIGFLNLASSHVNAFEDVPIRELQAFANQAAVAIENARMYSEIKMIAIEDELTGLYNRRGLFALGQREVERAIRFNRPLAVLFLDIDKFKRFNDAYSYATGDQVLRLIGETLKANLREIDLIGRYGGEEFIVLLPETNLITAREVAERLRETIKQTHLSTRWGNLQVTVSIGVSLSNPGRHTIDELIHFTGQILHIAKRDGRDRVEVEPEP